MIARVWHGWTKPENAKAYEDMLRDEIFLSIAARNIKGYRGAELFINEDGDEVEFMTLTGDTLAVVSLFPSQIREVGEREVGHARLLETVS